MGRDMELEEGECGIISIDDDGSDRDFIPYALGGAFLLLTASGAAVIRLKKVK